MKNILKYKKPAFWIIIAALLVCVIVAICFLTNPNKITAPTTYQQSGQKLSELSEDECLAFIASRGIKIPDALNGENIGEFVKEHIMQSEKNSKNPFDYYSATMTVEFAEAIRKAVNEYYGVDGGTYILHIKTHIH